jgi:RNA polymerase sigma-70 factor (ECF subfamily)
MDIATLFRTHAGFVERVLRRAGVAERDVGDAAQEVFLVVHRKQADFEGRSQPRTWLYGIAWNVASETRRRAYRRRELLDSVAEPAAQDPSAFECVADRQRMAALFEAIARLPPQQREAVIGHELDEQPMRELAKRLGIPVKTVFSRVYAARRALQQELRKQGFACSAWWALPLRRISRAADWFGPDAGLGCLAGPKSTYLLAAVVMCGAQWLPLHANPYTTGGAAHQAVVLPTEYPVSTACPTAAAAAMLSSPTAARVIRASATVHAPKHIAPSRAQPMAASQASRAGDLGGLAAGKRTVQDTDAQMHVVHTGALDLGLGPFGQSALADPPLVAPQQHPRAKLVVTRRN